MPSLGYVRFPTIYHDLIVFVSEDDLWQVSSKGGRAERLTAGTGRVSHPRFSPDGQWIAYVGREEGPEEVYVMPAQGGPARRLTFDGVSCRVVGWTPDGSSILYTSNAGQFHHDYNVIYAVSPEGGVPHLLPYGMASAVSFGPGKGVVIGRNTEEPAYWKRYRGGNVGHLWCDPTGEGTFTRLLNLNGNITDPCWIGARIYFLSDHEGTGNIYSCTPAGEDLQRHTDFHDFYARHLSTDGEQLVFQMAADLYLFDPRTGHVQQVPLTMPGPRTQLNRKFVAADHYLDTFALHPRGHAVALTTRGKAFTMSNWEGAVVQHGEQDGVRYRFLEWLNDGHRLVAICDAPGYETLVIFNPDSDEEPQMLTELDLGRVLEFEVSPTADIVAITNHRQELILVDLATSMSMILDASEHARIYDLAWSPDGQWIAYSFPLSGQKRAIKIGNINTGETHVVTDPVRSDVSPSFDPDGRFLYFLSYRVFNPVSDNMQFEWSFPHGVIPYALPLRNDIRSPFEVESRLLKDRQPDTWKTTSASVEETIPGGESAAQEEKVLPATPLHEVNSGPRRTVRIQFEGITSRAVPFPTGEARYDGILALRGKVLFLVSGLNGELSGPAKGWVECYDFETQNLERIADSVNELTLSRDGSTLLYRSRTRLRVLRNCEKPRSESNTPSKESGWLDLDRVKVSVQPASEWKQMFAEAWRLQREHFWTEDMSGIDWDSMYARYAPLLERVSSRSELSDLIHELQGELGTSHTYEYGGAYRQGVYYRQGSLGVDWHYDEATGRYRIARIIKGDPLDREATSPLTAPGLNIEVGDAVLAINGQRVSAQRSPQALLVNQAEYEVQLTIESAKTGETRIVTVHAISLAMEREARYRDWVETNRRYVHERSQGRVGYIHIPNMGPKGYAEFHRGFLAEYDRPGLIVDVRWNGGGNVSGLLLEKLARKRLGCKISRWGQPAPYPKEAPRGPMVALTNEHAGSDGDIFSHAFKLMNLGPLIGTRTWGGVIGYTLNHHLVDGTTTTQPEYANWFIDVGWNIENYGTDPDIEVDIAPQDFVQGSDPQLDRAIEEALRLASEQTVLEPKPRRQPQQRRLGIWTQSAKTASTPDEIGA